MVPFNRRCAWWPMLLRRAPWVVRRDGKPLWTRLRRERGLLCRGGSFDSVDTAAKPLVDGRALPPGQCDLLIVRLDFAGFKGVALRPDCAAAPRRRA